MADGISVREFARREGVSDTLVHQAIKQGRLKKNPDGKMDPALLGGGWRAGRRWQDATDGTQDTLQSGAKGLAYGEALRLKENFTAMLRRLEYEQKAGTVIEMAVARGVVFDLTRQQRDTWLAWPVKVAPFIAAELGIADVEQVNRVLATYVHEQLAELGQPEPRFSTGEARQS